MDLDVVNTYLYLETIAFFLGVIYNFSNVVFVVTGRAQNMYILLVVNAFFINYNRFFLYSIFWHQWSCLFKYVDKYGFGNCLYCNFDHN